MISMDRIKEITPFRMRIPSDQQYLNINREIYFFVSAFYGIN